MVLITKLPIVEEETLKGLLEDIQNARENYVGDYLQEMRVKDPFLIKLLERFFTISKNPEIYLGASFFIHDGLSKEGPIPEPDELFYDIMRKRFIEVGRMASPLNYFSYIGRILNRENPVLGTYFMRIVSSAHPNGSGPDALAGGLHVYDYLNTQVEGNRKRNSLN